MWATGLVIDWIIGSSLLNRLLDGRLGSLCLFLWSPHFRSLYWFRSNRTRGLRWSLRLLLRDELQFFLDFFIFKQFFFFCQKVSWWRRTDWGCLELLSLLLLLLLLLLLSLLNGRKEFFRLLPDEGKRNWWD